MDVRAFVDDVWAGMFDITREELRTPGVRVVTDPPWLEGYRGLYLLRIETTCVIGAPQDVAELVADRAAGRSADDVFEPDRARELIAEDAGLVLGPSIHSYLDRHLFIAPEPCDAHRVTYEDEAVIAFRREIDEAEWSEGGFAHDADVVWGAFVDGQLVAMGNMTDFADHPADVGLVTHPSKRGRGHGARLAGAMIVDALRTIPVVRYRALESNRPSRRVASKLGFIDHGSNIAVRLRV